MKGARLHKNRNNTLIWGAASPWSSLMQSYAANYTRAHQNRKSSTIWEEAAELKKLTISKMLTKKVVQIPVRTWLAKA